MHIQAVHPWRRPARRSLDVHAIVQASQPQKCMQITMVWRRLLRQKRHLRLQAAASVMLGRYRQCGGLPPMGGRHRWSPPRRSRPCRLTTSSTLPGPWLPVGELYYFVQPGPWPVISSPHKLLLRACICSFACQAGSLPRRSSVPAAEGSARACCYAGSTTATPRCQ